MTDLKESEPGKWYRMAKRLGAVDQMNNGEIRVEELEGLGNKVCAEKIAQAFASVSNEYLPINLSKLPSYRPTLEPPKVLEHEVYEKINKLKNTKSTFHIDLPNKVRKEFSADLASPVTDIINISPKTGDYP